MIRLMTVFVLGLLGLALMGCANTSRYHGQYGSNRYMVNAQTIPPIDVPRGIASPVADQLYPIPWTIKGQASPTLSLMPPDPNYQHYLWQLQQKKKKTPSHPITN